MWEPGGRWLVPGFAFALGLLVVEILVGFGRRMVMAGDGDKVKATLVLSREDWGFLVHWAHEMLRVSRDVPGQTDRFMVIGREIDRALGEAEKRQEFRDVLIRAMDRAKADYAAEAGG